MIYYITPYAHDKCYGKAINEHVKCFPLDAWICLRDQDTVFLPNAGGFLEQAIIDNPEVQLFTCATNRTYGGKMLKNADIGHHYKVATDLEKKKKYSVLNGIVPAFFWLFPRSLWVKHPFDNHPIIHKKNSFDVRWTRHMDVKKMRIEHLYLFHIYRLFKRPGSIEHLQ